MMTKLQQEAEQKAQELLRELNPSVGMIDTDQVVQLVQKRTNYDIKVRRGDFSRIGIDDLSNFGGMISIIKKSTHQSKGQAIIYLNTKKSSPQMMRFSLMHEIGHLMTSNLETLEQGKVYVSPQINADITYLNDAKIQNDEFLEKEQAANIFALSILMPKEQFKIISKQCVISKIANIFGVTEEAVLSRFLMMEAGC